MRVKNKTINKVCNQLIIRDNTSPEIKLWDTALCFYFEDAVREALGIKCKYSTIEAEAARRDIEEGGSILKHLCRFTGYEQGWVQRKYWQILEVLEK